MDSAHSPMPNISGQGRKIVKQSIISSTSKKQMHSANERAPPAAVAAPKSASSIPIEAAEGPRGGLSAAAAAANTENTLFNKHYNKELKLCEDEIPMVLCELNESALAYLQREQFENALLLL